MLANPLIIISKKEKKLKMFSQVLIKALDKTLIYRTNSNTFTEIFEVEKFVTSQK